MIEAPSHVAIVGQNPPLVNIKIGGKWMNFIHPKMEPWVIPMAMSAALTMKGLNQLARVFLIPSSVGAWH